MVPPRASDLPAVPELADPALADQQRVTADYNKDNSIPSRPRSGDQLLLPVHQPRPLTPRRDSGSGSGSGSRPTAQTDSTSSQSRPRNRSPFSRSHLRARSTTAPASMSRAQSLPPRSTSPYSPNLSSGRLSPLPRSPKRSGSPFRPASRESDHSTTSPSFYDGFEDIPEDGELNLSTYSAVTPSYHTSMKPSRSLSGRRQRPTSPVSGQLTSSISSPALSSSGRFNETYPNLHHYGSYSSISSMPSTPSSNRSRSPSISSLDTIEDAPDLEWEAIEADRIAKLKAAADAEEQDEEETQRRSSLEIPGQRPVGFGFGRQNQRKRWSVCGAERRADLDLETIWED